MAAIMTTQQRAVRDALIAMYGIDIAIGNEPYVPPTDTTSALLAAVTPGGRLASRTIRSSTGASRSTRNALFAPAFGLPATNVTSSSAVPTSTSGSALPGGPIASPLTGSAASRNGTPSLTSSAAPATNVTSSSAVPISTSGSALPGGPIASPLTGSAAPGGRVTPSPSAALLLSSSSPSVPGGPPSSSATGGSSSLADAAAAAATQRLRRYVRSPAATGGTALHGEIPSLSAAALPLSSSSPPVPGVTTSTTGGAPSLADAAVATQLLSRQGLSTVAGMASPSLSVPGGPPSLSAAALPLSSSSPPVPGVTTLQPRSQVRNRLAAMVPSKKSTQSMGRSGRPSAPKGTLPGLFGTEPLPTVQGDGYNSASNTNAEDANAGGGSGAASGGSGGMAGVFGSDRAGSNSNGELLLTSKGKSLLAANRRQAAAAAEAAAAQSNQQPQGMQYLTSPLARSYGSGKKPQGGGARKSRRHSGIRNRKTQRRK